MAEPTATHEASMQHPADPAGALPGTPPPTPAEPQTGAVRPWVREPSHSRAAGATLLLLALWATGTLAAPWLARPVSDVAQWILDVTGLSTPLPAEEEPAPAAPGGER